MNRLLRIILIEDQPVVRDLIAELLALEGHHVTTCADRESALVALAAANSGDLVALDWIVPGVDGDELLQTVLNHPAQLKCLILSGYAIETGRYPAGWRARIAYLEKPFSPSMLMERVNFLGSL